ncbi:MAG: M48 family metallopeptidase [Hyphomicrobiaceae bacterium]
MQRFLFGLAFALALLVAGAPGGDAREPEEGVKVGRPSFVRRLWPAGQIERSAQQQFLGLQQQANAKRALMPANHPQTQRLHRIAREILPHTFKWNPRAKDWKWEVVLINSPNINAFCMPGGKIAFFTGILEKLQLTDDEVAMIMGHEMAHALREHARERAVKGALTQVGARVLAGILFGEHGDQIGAASGSLLTLKFGRDDESESDLIGMELAARAGYNPAAGVTLWEKMAQASRGAPPQWLSTHPASESRIKHIQDNLKDVAGLYERAKAAKAQGLPVPQAAPSPTPAGQRGPTRASPPGQPTILLPGPRN